MVDPEAADFVVPPLPLNKPVIGLHIAKVLQSHHNPDFQPGDLVTGYFPFQEVHVIPNRDIPERKVYRLKNPHGLDLRHYLGILGHTGMTAYSSLREICRSKPGETIFVSAASGAVGQAVGVFAKHEGLKVLGSVGSDAKLDYILHELGFDGGFNYKREKPGDALKRLAPEGIDIYYENVGGEHLEAALLAMRPYGRIAVSGMISQYNKPYGQYAPLRNIWEIMPSRLTMTGFVATEPQFQAYREEHQERVQQWLKEVSVKEKLWEVQGIENAAEGFVALFTGETFGKAVLKC